MYNVIKAKYFGGDRYMIGYQTKETKEEWLKEKALTDCENDCQYAHDCAHRNNVDRFPADAGGKGQCIRLAQHMSPFAFVNVNQDVVIIPDEIIGKIRNSMED